MKHFFSKIIGLFLVTFVLMAFVPADGIGKKQKYKAFLGCTLSDSIQISVNDFLDLIQKPICAKDSSGSNYKIEKFEIFYAERGLYQDEEGLPIIVTDYSNVLCKGDTIPQKWIKNFYERAYKGDTIYFDKPIVRSSDNKLFECKSIKVILK